MNRITNTDKNYNSFLSYSYEIKSQKKSDISYSSDYDIKNMNKKNNSLSLISEDSLIMNNYNNKNNINKIQKNFVKNKNLNDYTECPLIQNKNNQDKINDFIFLLDNIDNIIEIDEINKLKTYQKKIKYNDNFNDGEIIMDNFDIINYGTYENDLLNKEKKQIFINENMDNKPKYIIAIIPNKKEDLSNSLIKKHRKIMNQNYILLMQKYTKDQLIHVILKIIIIN